MHALLSLLARSRRVALWALCAALASAAAGCAGKDDGLPAVVFEEPETAIDYDVVLEGAPSPEVTDIAEQSLSVYLLRDQGAPSVAFLRRRAESDVPTLLQLLRSRGYYTGTARVRVEAAAAGTQADADTQSERARVVLTIDPGPAFTLTRHSLRIERSGTVEPPALDAAALGSPVGRQALAAKIAGAESAAVRALKTGGFPYAAYRSRSGLADPKTATLEVESIIDAGPAYVFGDLGFAGLETVDEDYLRSYQPWKEGQSFNLTALTEFQRDLFATDLFRAVTVRIPDAPPEAAAEPAPLPVTVEAEEGPRHRIAGSLRYSTDLGPAVRASYEHRNLFGANERFLAQAEAGLVEQKIGFGVRKPQFLRPGQDLRTDLAFTRTVDDAYDAETISGFVGLERQLSPRWRVGIGGLAEASLIDDNGEDARAYLLGVPAFANYDSSNDLFNPTQGARLRLEATPFTGVNDGSDTEFLVLDAKGSAYLPLDAERRYIVAGRGRVATILAPEFTVIPPTRRLYSGGGNSVRGYAENYIGPLDDDDNPVGGRSAVEGGIEFRARLFGDIGGVVFAEAGSVSTEMVPDLDDGVQVAGGLGVRYFSPAGPIRVDVAVPVNRRSADDRFQVYFSIGQAF
jgi:translocation and assembly module TamA